LSKVAKRGLDSRAGPYLDDALAHLFGSREINFGQIFYELGDACNVFLDP
jgi:hypothetical protein